MFSWWVLDSASKCDMVTIGNINYYTIAPNGSEFSHRVWISFFLFYFLALSFRNFMGSHHIIPMYIYIILLRNTNSRNSWKIIAGMISQWFWCKYFAHIFILYSKCSKKIYRLPRLYLNTAGYSLRVPSVVFLCLGGKKRSVTIPHCVLAEPEIYWHLPHACQNVCVKNFSKRVAAALSGRRAMALK